MLGENKIGHAVLWRGNLKALCTSDEVMAQFKSKHTLNDQRRADEDMVLANLRTALSMMEGEYVFDYLIDITQCRYLGQKKMSKTAILVSLIL